MDLGEEERNCHNSDPRHSSPSLFDLHSNLVLEKLRVVEGCFIENEDVG